MLHHKFDQVNLFVRHVNGRNEGKYVLLVKRQWPLRKKKHRIKLEVRSTKDGKSYWISTVSYSQALGNLFRKEKFLRKRI